MICKKCNTDNESNARYCRKCGGVLVKPSLVDTYPSHKFMPTSTHSLVGRTQFRVLKGILLFAIIIGTIASIMLCINPPYYGPGESEIIALIVVVPVVITLAIILANIWKHAKSVNLSNIADYVQTSNQSSRYVFVGKNELLGVFDRKENNLIIPCRFIDLRWISYGNILEGQDSEGKFMRLDTLGNEI